MHDSNINSIGKRQQSYFCLIIHPASPYVVFTFIHLSLTWINLFGDNLLK